MLSIAWKLWEVLHLNFWNSIYARNFCLQTFNNLKFRLFADERSCIDVLGINVMRIWKFNESELCGIQELRHEYILFDDKKKSSVCTFIFLNDLGKLKNLLYYI